MLIVNIEVKDNAKGNVVYSKQENISVKNWQYKTFNFSIPLKDGDYTATSTALGIKRSGKIAIQLKKILLQLIWKMSIKMAFLR